MLRYGIAGLALAVGIAAAAAQDMKSPRIAPTHVDWDAVAVELDALDLPKPVVVPEVMAKLNRATGERFANIAASPVPVLLPFDTAAFLRDRAAASDPAAASANSPADDYLSGFNAVPFFYPGPAGYDAMVIARAQEMRELGIGFSDPIYIHIGGSALVYQLDEPRGVIGWPVHGLDEFPAIRRTFLENYVRYTFVRYGVPYVVAIECSDGRSRFVFSNRCGSRAARRRPNRRRSPPIPSIGRRSSPRSSPTTAPATSFPAPAFGAKVAWPTTRSIPRSVSRSPTRRPSPIPSRS